MTTPLFMRDVSLTLKLLPAGPTRVQYNCDVHTAEVLAAAGDTVEYRTLCPTGTYSSITATSYALHIVAAQDWSATGLARFLWENDGALAEFQYQPHGAAVMPPTTSQPGMTGTVRLVAPTMGGEADTFAELDVEMPCTVKPTLAITTFPALDELAADEAAADEEAAEAVA